MIDDRETLDMEGLLRFYAEAGVDMPLSDTPIDRFAEAQRQPVRSAPAQQENRSTSSAERPRAQQQQPRQAATPSPTSRPVQAASDVPDNAKLHWPAKPLCKPQRLMSCAKSLQPLMAAI